METLKNLSGMQKFLIGLILGLVLGWGGTYFALDQAAWKNSNCGPRESPADCAERLSSPELDTVLTSDETPLSGEIPTGVFVPGTNAVSVEDQTAGDKVEVTMITLSKAGWVVVHEDQNGAPGKVLGARRYDQGIFLGEVELLRGTVAGNTYYVMLHTDDGDRQFDLTKDLPILNAADAPVQDSFVAR